MSTTAWVVYGVVALVVSVVVTTYFEHERKNAPLIKDRQATLRPGLDGVVVGVCWPLTVVIVIPIGIFWLFSAIGRFVDSFLEKRSK